MMAESRMTIHAAAAAAIAVALLLTGAGVSYLLTRNEGGAGEQVEQRTAGPPAITESAPAMSNAPLPDVTVPLTPEAVRRAGIVVSAVTSGTSSAEIRLPGVVEPNAYKEVAVTPLVAGRVTRVAAELGDRVRRGQTLAQIYSPELAEAQTRYVSARALLDAHDRELQRTEKLVEIGAASRQELERIHAEHAAQTAAVESARTRLELLGVPASTLDALASGTRVSATTSVPAPITGVVTERTANIGLNVDLATELFTVVDLSTVWVVADAYERDFARVPLGGEATVRIPAYPDLAIRGRISYIDPRVSPETRTAKVRVEVPNAGGELRLGMYADVVVRSEPGAVVPIIPRSAVQNVGDRTMVYVAMPDEDATFVEREVRLGNAMGEQIEVLSGLQPGDVVVTEGSFFVRAERERLGLRRGPPSVSEAGDVQTARVVVSERGFEPAHVTVRAGAPVRLTFIRTTDNTCGTEVVFSSLDIRRALPLNAPVDIAFTPQESGELSFACGMNMLRGAIVVQ